MLYRSTIAAMVAAALSLTAAAAQDDPRYPDWSGQWRKAPDGGPPRYDPSRPDGVGQQAPLKDEYRRIHEAKGNPNIIYDEITTIDNALTRPWSIKKTYRRAESCLAGEQLHGRQQRRGHRQRELSVECGWLPDAGEEGPAATAPALFQSDEKVRGSRIDWRAELSLRDQLAFAHKGSTRTGTQSASC
jgi:hypothetical protein